MRTLKCGCRTWLMIRCRMCGNCTKHCDCTEGTLKLGVDLAKARLDGALDDAIAGCADGEGIEETTTKPVSVEGRRKFTIRAGTGTDRPGHVRREDDLIKGEE